MKIIDLYNIIAKGQTPPKRIRYQGLIFNWDSEKYLHYKDKSFRETNLLEGIVTELCLNHEVEIIEDKIKKIEKLNIKDNCLIDERGVGCTLNKHTRVIANKLNEIIDGFNYLSEKSGKYE